MNSDENLKDESLLRCTIKKSISVLTKVVRYVLYAAVITIAIAGLGYVGYIGLPVIIGICSALVASLISLLALIPWYVYVIVGIILAIPVYSFLWCIARDLTDEDWNSDTAVNVAIIILVAAFVIFGVFIYVATISLNSPIILVLVLVVALITFALDMKPMLFVGAVWHHYKQKKIKEELKRQNSLKE